MAEDQQFYRQYLQSTGADGASTVREVVSPTLLDHDAAAAAEQQAGRTFAGFVAPDKMPTMTAAPARPTPPPTPPLPSDVIPTAGTVPSGYTPPPVAAPGGSPWLNLLPPALATAGPLALSIMQPELGIPLWLASGGLATLGGGGGEALREHLAGEPLSPMNIVTQGVVSGATEGVAQAAAPYVSAGLRAVAGRMVPTLGAIEELGPVLATRDAATAAAPTAAAWVNSARQAAAQTANPVVAMRAQYDALGPELQGALFGEQRPAFERLLQTAWGGTREEIEGLLGRGVASGGIGGGAVLRGLPHLPYVAGGRFALDVGAPFVARGALLQPPVAAFGGTVSRVTGQALPAAERFVAQSYAERARQAGLPF